MPDRNQNIGPIKGTKLSPEKERLYQQWRAKLPKPLQYEGDYDLRGLWNENPNVKPSPNLHFTDKYKLPNHPTFSNESKYFNEANKHMGGQWQETDSSFNYIPFNPNIKDTVIEMKEGVRKQALAPNPDVESINWAKSYVASPKYNERLSAFYKYPDYIQRKRADVLNGIKISENAGTASKYWPQDNEIRVSPTQIQSLGALRPEVVVHEGAHALNWGNNKAAALTPNEAKFILERNKNVSGARAQELLKSAKESNQYIGDYLSGSTHDINPAESLSDIQAFRFLLNKRGIHDARKENITPEMLKRAKSDPILKKSFTMKRLLNNFNDEQLIEIMNKVASNTGNKPSNIA